MAVAESESVGAAQFGEFAKRMEDRFEAVDQRFEAMDQRFEAVDQRFVSMEKRMEEGFAHVNQLADQRYDSINQRFADAEKARDQNMVHVNQRFDSLEKRFDDLRTLIVVMYTPIAIAILGAVVKWFFFSD